MFDTKHVGYTNLEKNTLWKNKFSLNLCIKKKRFIH